MDLRKIKKLMELLEESGIAEIEVKEGEESIKLSRNFGYFSRRFISKRFIKKLYDKADFFEGSAGDIYILNTSQCLHGATIPKKDSYRDILVFIYTEDKPSKNIDSQPVLYSKTSSKK